MVRTLGRRVSYIRFFQQSVILGVSHCDDLLYLFRSPALFPDLDDIVDISIMEMMTDLWTSFAIHG